MATVLEKEFASMSKVDSGTAKTSNKKLAEEVLNEIEFDVRNSLMSYHGLM